MQGTSLPSPQTERFNAEAESWQWPRGRCKRAAQKHEGSETLQRCGKSLESAKFSTQVLQTSSERVFESLETDKSSQ